jgi:Ni/Co efflux regulator RcnB
MKKIVFGIVFVALAAGTLSAAVNDGGKGKKKKSCCQSSGSGCNKDKAATPAQ